MQRDEQMHVCEKIINDTVDENSSNSLFLFELHKMRHVKPKNILLPFTVTERNYLAKRCVVPNNALQP